jgi:hypothetical protein
MFRKFFSEQILKEKNCSKIKKFNKKNLREKFGE